MKDNDTKVKYLKNDRVQVNMSMNDYQRLLKQLNTTRDAIVYFDECKTFNMEHIRNFDEMAWTMGFKLGFRRQDIDCYGLYHDCVLPKDTNPRPPK